MKRRLFKLAPRILLFVLLGAIVNVAVAWGFAAFTPPSGAHWITRSGWHRFAEPVIQNGKELDWIIHRHDSVGNTRLQSNAGWSDRTGRKGPEASAICPLWTGYPAPLDDGSETSLNINASGWPLRCLVYRWVTKGSLDKDGKPNPPTIKFVHGMGLSDFEHPSPGMNMLHVRGLPLEPIWPGFAINTILYAGILWLLFAFPFTLRRGRRIKRGLCPACAYPVGTSDVCSECGKNVSPARITVR